jgi:hypothetical protein
VFQQIAFTPCYEAEIRRLLRLILIPNKLITLVKYPAMQSFDWSYMDNFASLHKPQILTIEVRREQSGLLLAVFFF